MNLLALVLVGLALQTGTGPLSIPAPGGSGERTPLERAVSRALEADARLSELALFEDTVPRGAARAIAGPALRALAQSAALRRREGVRIRMLGSRLRIVSITRLPTGLVDVSASWAQRLAPTGARGVALGKTVFLREKARVVLRRRADGGLVVWRVEPLR